MSTSRHSWQILLHLQVFLLSRCAALSIPLARSPWEVAEVPRQLREVVCIPDSCTTQIFKQCLKQEKKNLLFSYDTIINLYQLLKALPEKIFLKQLIWPQLLIENQKIKIPIFNLFFEVFLGQLHFRSYFSSTVMQPLICPYKVFCFFLNIYNHEIETNLNVSEEPYAAMWQEHPNFTP